MAKILIIEDNPLNLKLFEDLLTAQGFDITTSVDGANAVKLVQDTKPDLILMDIHLPDLSGMEITEILKAEPTTAHVPVLAVTAFAMKGDREKILASGCKDYISKPITSIPDFVATIKQHLSEGNDIKSIDQQTQPQESKAAF